ncbi:beta-lactamase hydrolase domain-containing protein [Lyngbya aestuarii]|uniref:beta-lactamase hydrolase domain-containing protein n=1 Tax=Lyngbya aestuarii TaxID=118322 RepID=UPI00403D802E
MIKIRKISDELAISGQVTLTELQQIAQQGFKSVLNLCSPDEEDFLIEEQEQVYLLKLHYRNLPLKTEAINQESISQVLQQIKELPKPVLVHCNNAMRSSAVVLIYLAMRQGATFDQALNKAEELDLFRVLIP